MAPGTADKNLVEPICERGYCRPKRELRRIEGGGQANGLGVDYFF
jgi:hypothetical protein